MRRFCELLKRYGEDTVLRVMDGELDASEKKLRERLRTIPDGIYRARDYLDHDGHQNRLYQVCVAIEKRGNELIFDMEGTSPQAPGFINCTYSGMRGAVQLGFLTRVLTRLAANLFDARYVGISRQLVFPRKIAKAMRAYAAKTMPLAGIG